MITYLPWGEQNLISVLGTFQNGNMPILDLESSARCKHRLTCGGCIYCDSSTGVAHSNELTMDETKALLLVAKRDLDLRWIYCCGLGEPWDDPKFRPLVDLASEQGISISVFTNGMDYTRNDLSFLYDHGVSLLIKCDSFNPEVFGRLLGTDDLAVVRSIYRVIDMAIEVGFGDLDSEGCSRLALSIVPTQYNKYDIIEVVSFCKANHLFPLLGQLEYAGRGRAMFDTLALKNEELLEIKAEIEAILEAAYEIPVCPASIAGIHINNIGECIVQKGTGLSCSWFDLSEPEVVALGNVREMTLHELWREIQRYRVQRIGNIRRWSDNVSKDVFGGCGGKALLETYLRIQSTVD